MNLMRKVVLIVGVVALSGLVPTALPQNPLMELIPELKTLPAPDWVKEGVRISYYSSAASVPANRHYFWRDDAGDWVDEQGNRYFRGDEPGPAGHGFTQIDVCALDGGTAALSIKSYGLANGTGPVVPLGAGSYVGQASAGADYWINPRALQGVADRQTGGLTILHLPYKLGEKSFNAIRFQSESANGRQAWVYDLETGILLLSNSMTPAADASRTQLTHCMLVNLRALKLPWTGAAPPSWIASVKRMRYEGGHTTVVPGSPPFSLPLAASMEFGARGKNWIQYNQTTELGSVGGLPPTTGSMALVSGPGQIGGLWLPPAGLRDLKPGQTIDTDPVTAMEVAVAQIGQGSNGNPVVLITENGKGSGAEYYYDVTTGVLLGGRFTDRILNTQIELKLTGQQ